MWTNVFKIGGLRYISWFQFLPNEADALSEKSSRVDHRDVSAQLVLSAHLQLQAHGFFSTWTNSFVGPWDPSQGVYNPDEKIKLWLFLPGRHSSVDENAQSAVAKLRVVGAGVWTAPGDSEEVAAALSQALRNHIERSLRGLSYKRFGDSFIKCQYIFQSEPSRKVQLAIEFVFAATEEAILILPIICGKQVRPLSSDDIESVLRCSSDDLQGLKVVVAPHGMEGRMTGCCPEDLVKQVYFSKPNSSDSSDILDCSMPAFAQCSNYRVKGQSCYVEVTLGCPVGKGNVRKGLETSERIFIYPADMVLVPQLYSSFARHHLRSPKLTRMVAVSPDDMRKQQSCSSSSPSNSSSVSSTSSTHSNGQVELTAGADGLEADSESLMSRQTGLSTNDTIDIDNSRRVKRLRTGDESLCQKVNVINAAMQEVQMCAYSGVGGNNSNVTGVVDNQLGAQQWDWDDDDRGVDMDIQTLLSEFGDFGDFFENDVLAFGEPPGTAESQALVFPASDVGDVNSSPVSLLDMSDPITFPPASFPTPSACSQVLPVASDEATNTSQEIMECRSTCFTAAPCSRERDHLTEAEAMMAFAPEYNAVETSCNEFSLSIFRSPYLPKSQKMGNMYPSFIDCTYSAVPPLLAALEIPNGKQENITCKAWDDSFGQCMISSLQCNKDNLYIQSGQARETNTGNSCMTLCKDDYNLSVSGLDSSNGLMTFQKIMHDHKLDRYLLMSSKTVLAMEIECLLFQTAMSKIRHISSSNSAVVSVFADPISNTPLSWSHCLDNMNYQQKAALIVGITGESEGNMHGSDICNAPAGVWRSAEASKGPILPNSPCNESEPVSMADAENRLTHPLQRLVNALPFLVQLATSFVDITFDTIEGSGPFDLLAFEEQQRRGLSCGPSLVHAGCGGCLSASHTFDIAGMSLLDPFSAEVSPSSVISLLQSDIKGALESAFGDVVGPLLITDMCKGWSPSIDSIDAYTLEIPVNESKDAASSISLISEAISPSQSSTNSLKGVTADGSRLDEKKSTQDPSISDLERNSWQKATIVGVPFPSLLVGYQDDWLMVPADVLQLWEKAPLEPYALQKPIIYNVLCPDIHPLVFAAADFFQQLGTVYEACRLGTHVPHQAVSGQAEVSTEKWSQSGFVLIDSPQAVKEASGSLPFMCPGNQLLTFSRNWDLRCFLDTLSRTLEAVKFATSVFSSNQKGVSAACMVIYVICPFIESHAVLQTLVTSSAVLGSKSFPSNKESSLLHVQIERSLCPAAADGTAEVFSLSGFTTSKLVLQIIAADFVCGVGRPGLSELSLLKEIAFTVYNKVRRIRRPTSVESISSSCIPGRPYSTGAQTHASVSDQWKDCVTSRISGSSNDLDTSLRPGSWHPTWQNSRTGVIGYESNVHADKLKRDEEYLFEPLFILADAGSVNYCDPLNADSRGPSSRNSIDDKTAGYMQTSVVNAETGSTLLLEHSEPEVPHSSSHKSVGYHCCYEWTEDWRWLVCIWTDSRGELLDCQIFPYGGTSSRQDTKGLHSLFVKILQKAFQILASVSLDGGIMKPRDVVIARVGCFYELEVQEWQKAIYSFGGNEVKRWWPLRLRKFAPESNSGSQLQGQDMTSIADPTMTASASLLFNQQAKSSFARPCLGQNNLRKQMMQGVQGYADSSRMLIQWVQSISLVTVSADHTLHLILSSDNSLSGCGGGIPNLSNYLDGFGPVKSLGHSPISYILIPSPSMKFLPPVQLQLPTCLSADSPPLAHLLQSKGSAIPLLTGFVVSKSVPSMGRNKEKAEWPSVLSVSLVDHYGGSSQGIQESIAKGSLVKHAAGFHMDAKDYETEARIILESVAVEMHALSWMTVSPIYLERRTAFPFHCDMVLRLRRLLHYGEKCLIKP